jgi:hypothetical protein
MSSAEDYLRSAEECRHKAQAATSFESRLRWVEMAERWEDLAKSIAVAQFK